MVFYIDMSAIADTPENYAGNGLLAECHYWQGVIDRVATSVEKDTVGRLACRELNSVARSDGSPKVLVRSYRAVVLPGELAPADEAEVVEVLEFDKVVATGWLGRINYLVMNQERALTWPIYDVHVLNPTEKEVTAADMAEPPQPYLPIDIRGPVHLPVGYIDFAVYSG
jgi:hypothetical protein